MLRLKFQFGGVNDFADVIQRLRGEDPGILAMKARVIGAEGRYEESIALLNTFSGVENLSARVVIETSNSNSPNAIQACVEGLALEQIPESTRQLFTLMKARARFAMAMDKSGTATDGVIIPPAGIPGMDVGLLRQAWQDIQEAVELLKDSGWPSNVDFVADIWSGAASMLGKLRDEFPLLLQAANARHQFATLQTAAESAAALCGDFENALTLNSRTPDSDTKWLRRTAYLHELNRHRDCIEMLEAHLPHLNRGHQIFGQILPMAIVSARRLAKTELAMEWTAILESDPKLAPFKAVADYLSAVDANKLAKADAVRNLQIQYEALGKPKPIALLLFMSLDPCDDEQAAACIDMGNDVRESTTLPGDAAVHLGMAMVTMRRWDELLSLCQESGRQFEGVTRLTAFEGMALDRLGRTDEARRLLEGLINEGKTDQFALNTYVNIMARGGFLDEAIKTTERILELAVADAQKMECVRLLFKLEQSANPASPRLLELAQRMGELADPTVEEEEGVYLMMMLMGTLLTTAPPKPEQIQAFHSRCDAFFRIFPNSKIIKRAEINSEASADAFLKSIHDAVGLDEAHLAFQAKLENQLQAGAIPIPYAWRPRRVLRNVNDVVEIWESTKRSGAADRKHHLHMMVAPWAARPAANSRALIPLIDLTSLLVVSDLGLFDHLFSYFKKIAISKGTLLELSKLTQPLSGSPWLAICKSLQDRLREHFEQILQPGSEPEDEEDPKLDGASEEIKRICATGDYTLYSDDVMMRVYCGGDVVAAQGICTGDLLSGLEESGALTTAEVAQKVSLLCSWHVGLQIEFKYQMAIVPDEVRKIDAVKRGVDVLQNSPSFMSMATAMWDFRTDFMVGAKHIGNVMQLMVEDAGLAPTAIASFVGIWYVKAKLRSDAPHPPMNILAKIVQLAAAHIPRMDENSSRRLWAVFLALVEFEFGDRMDEGKERDAIELMAQQCASLDLDVHNPRTENFSIRFAKGFTPGTANADVFAKANVLAKVQIGLAKQESKST